MAESSRPVIPMAEVKSSNVAKVGYDAASNTLAVQFNNGGVYHYTNFPARLYGELQAAESIGSFLAKNVRGKFTATKVN